MGLFSELDTASCADLQTWWHTPNPAWAEEHALALEELAYALCHCGLAGIALLQAATSSPDHDRRRAALMALAWPATAPPTIHTDLRAAFIESNPALKTAALWGCMHLKTYLLPRTDVKALLQHSDERLSALAMVYLSYADPHKRMTRLRQALRSANPRQREYACDIVGDDGITELHAAVAALRNDPDDAVRAAAHSALGETDHT